MDEADFSALFFADDDDSPAQAAALAQALSRDRKLGMLGMLTGDKVLGGVGQQLLKGAGQREGQLADVGQRRQAGALQRMLAERQQAAQAAQHTASEAAAMERLKYGEGQQNYRHKLEMGAKSEHEKAAAAAAAVKAEKEAKKEAFGQTEGLRKELTNNQVTKQFQDVDSAFAKVANIAEAAPSPAGDIALVFSFMKIADPGSSVKEGEAATAQNATNVPGQVQNIWNRMQDGYRLTPEQRQDFLRQANNLYKAHSDQYETLRGQYKGYARKAGLDDADIDLGLPVRELKPKGGAKAPGGGWSDADEKRLQELEALSAQGGAK